MSIPPYLRLLGSVTLSLRTVIQKGKEEVNTTLKNDGGEIVRGEEETGSVVVGTYAHTTVSYRSIHLSTYIILYMWGSHVENEHYSTLVKNELAMLIKAFLRIVRKV